MSISLAIGGNAPLSINGLTDLERLGQRCALQLGEEFSSQLHTTLSARKVNQLLEDSASSRNQSAPQISTSDRSPSHSST